MDGAGNKQGAVSRAEMHGAGAFGCGRPGGDAVRMLVGLSKQGGWRSDKWADDACLGHRAIDNTCLDQRATDIPCPDHRVMGKVM